MNAELRERIDNLKNSLPQIWGDDRFAANGSVTAVDPSLAPPPPPEEQEWIPGLMGSEPSAQKVKTFNPMCSPKGNALRGKHPNRLEAPPCPFCGSSNSWSKYKSANGKRRRKCMDCSKSWSWVAA